MSILQVINTSLLGDAQHIEQMNRQYHPASRDQAQPAEPSADAHILSQTQLWSAVAPFRVSPPGRPSKHTFLHLKQHLWPGQAVCPAEEAVVLSERLPIESS